MWKLEPLEREVLGSCVSPRAGPCPPRPVACRLLWGVQRWLCFLPPSSTHRCSLGPRHHQGLQDTAVVTPA